MNLCNATTGETILPAYFSDGYFNLLPGESRRLSVTYGVTAPVSIVTDGYNVKSTVTPSLDK
jgi:hypothetical protein